MPTRHADAHGHDDQDGDDDGHGGSRRGLVLLATALAVLLVAELGSRVLANRLPEPLQWHSYEAQAKVDQMDELSNSGGADVVFLGTSQMNSALEPVQFMERFDGAVTAYNAALSQGLPRASLPWAETVVFPRLDPDVVVIGLTSLDLVPTGPGRDEILDVLTGSPAARIEFGTASAIERVDQWLGEHSALVRHRSELRAPGDVLRALLDRPPRTGSEEDLIGPFGFQTYSVEQTFDTRDGRATQALRIAFPDFEVAGPDITALRTLVELAQDGGAEVVLVAMPVTAEYIEMHPAGVDDYEAFEATLALIADETGADLADLDDLGGRDHTLFADENHLNGAGTERFTDALVDILTRLGHVPARGS